MPLNKDGFEIGASVSFEQLAEHRGKANARDTIDRAAIADMKKAELVKHIEAHGGDTEGKVDDLRARLASILFVEL